MPLPIFLNYFHKIVFTLHNYFLFQLSKQENNPTCMNRFMFVSGFLLVFVFAVKSQPPMQASGTVSGKIADSRTNLPVEYANVLLFDRDTLLINGGVSNNAGVFIINDVPLGYYNVKISFIGYEDLWVDSVEINLRHRNILLEEILLSPSASMLENFRVTEQRSVLEMHIDRKVFNVDQSIVSQGQSATEVLETVPSVEVDMDGNVSLRGSGNVTILIDGRPSAMMGSDVATALKQIPANMIESVEIITNPSAKYDPEGMSGIINIKLRKDKKSGLNGVVTAGYGTWDKYNGSINLNYRTQKINLFTSYSINDRNYFRSGSTITTNKQQPDSFFVTSQDLFLKGYRTSQMVRGGADWFINPNNTISGFITLNSNGSNSSDTVNSRYENSKRVISALTERVSTSEVESGGYQLVLNWQKKFNKKGQELVADANYSWNEEEGLSNYEDYYSLWDYSNSDIRMLEEKRLLGKNRMASFQVDYTHPITTRSKFETGGRMGYRMMDDDQSAQRYDTTNATWIPDTNRTNRFVYSELISALYATYSGSINKLSYKAGIRFEQTHTSGELKTDLNEPFTNDYPSLFPSAHLSYKPNKNDEFQVSYSRRVTRPRSRMLNPFADYSDPMNIRQGNPLLKPEFTNSTEFSYARFFKKTSLITSVFYRQVNQQIERFKVITPEGITIMTMSNLSSGIQYGYELIGTYNPFKWWSMNANFNMNQRILDAENIQKGLKKSGLMWSTKLMSTMSLSTGTSLQFTGSYSSRRVLTLGISAPRYVMDLGVRQSLLKSRGSLSLRVSDVFYTSRWNMSLEGNGFSQEIERYFDSRVAYLTFTYQFGQQQRDNGAKKRAQRESNSDDSEGGGEMMY